MMNTPAPPEKPDDHAIPPGLEPFFADLLRRLPRDFPTAESADIKQELIRHMEAIIAEEQFLGRTEEDATQQAIRRIGEPAKIARWMAKAARRQEPKVNYVPTMLWLLAIPIFNQLSLQFSPLKFQIDWRGDREIAILCGGILGLLVATMQALLTIGLMHSSLNNCFRIMYYRRLPSAQDLKRFRVLYYYANGLLAALLLSGLFDLSNTKKFLSFCQQYESSTYKTESVVFNTIYFQTWNFLTTAFIFLGMIWLIRSHMNRMRNNLMETLSDVTDSPSNQ